MKTPVSKRTSVLLFEISSIAADPNFSFVKLSDRNILKATMFARFQLIGAMNKCSLAQRPSRPTMPSKIGEIVTNWTDDVC